MIILLNLVWLWEITQIWTNILLFLSKNLWFKQISAHCFFKWLSFLCWIRCLRSWNFRNSIYRWLILKFELNDIFHFHLIQKRRGLENTYATLSNLYVVQRWNFLQLASHESIERKLPLLLHVVEVIQVFVLLHQAVHQFFTF